MSEDFKSRAKKWPKGNHYEDFELGHIYQHHWGRTLNDGDNSLFSTLTLSFNPLYFNAGYAHAHGHGRVVLNPMLVFLTVFGLSVEDPERSRRSVPGRRRPEISSHRLSRRDP